MVQYREVKIWKKEAVEVDFIEVWISEAVARVHLTDKHFLHFAHDLLVVAFSFHWSHFWPRKNLQLLAAPDLKMKPKTNKSKN